MTMKMKLAAVAMVAVALLWSLPAHASTITIGLAENGGPITIVAGPDASGNAAFSGSFGSFQLSTVFGTGNPPLSNPQLLGSSSMNISGMLGNTNTLDVWVTSQGNVPLGPGPFASDLTTNVLPADWKAELKTWIGPDNMQFGTGTLIGDHTFNDIGTSEQVGSAPLTNPYSITAEYIITPGGIGVGSANSTIDVFSTPEPSSLVLLGMGLLGTGFSLRRKHR